jgi:hypothetical protein
MFSNFEKILRAKKHAIETAHTVHQKIAQENVRGFLTRGRQLQIYQTGVGYYNATYSQYQINLGIPRLKLGQYVKVNPRKNVSGQGKKSPANSTQNGKVNGKFAFIKLVLFDRPHSLRYARDALPGDPVSRLMILADTGHRDGSGELRILSAKGDYAVKCMNRLVDVFEGIDYYESIQLGRRLLSKKDRKTAAEMKAKKL